MPFLRIILFLSAAAGGALSAAEPVLTHVHPAAVQRGTEVEVKMTGKFDPWPCTVRAEAPGLVFTAGQEAGSFRVTAAAEAPLGPQLIRAVNAEGASAPVALVVTDTPQTLEVEPNDDFRAPQVLSASTATVNGRHEKADDVDSFGVTLASGQVLVAWVEAYVLAAGFDAMLRVVDDAGATLAFNHDHSTLDPFLVFTAPRDGRYSVQTMGHAYPASTDVRFAGGETCGYRLHLSTGPVVRNTWPLAVTRGSRTPVVLEGWNLAESRMEIDHTAPPAFPVVFSEVPELTESPEPPPLAPPAAVSGRIETPGGEDRHPFAASKDSVLELTVTGRRQGSEIDPWLKVRDSEGKELAAADDDGGSLEPRIVWTAPADGTYTAVVGDLTQRGGAGFFYRLLVTPAAPAATATVSAHAAKIEAGKQVEMKVTVALTHGFKQKLKLAALGLPSGVTAAEVEVPEKGGEVTLTLSADAAAPAAGTPFQVVLREVEAGREHPVLFSIATVSENNGVPQGYQHLLVNATDQLWLTVVPPPA